MKNHPCTPQPASGRNRARPSRLTDLITLGVALGCFTSLSGWAQQTAAPSTPQSLEKEDEVVELSPFLVTSSEEVGYQATSTLAGTRLNTDLKEIGAAVSVYTAEFLQDINVSKIEDILTYTAGTEGGGIKGNFSGISTEGLAGSTNASANSGDVRDNPSDVNRVRALAQATRTRDFFPTDIPSDNYNFDTVTINRGPNAILAGVGNAGGVIDTAMRKATFKDSYRAVLRVGSYGTHREELHFNKVIIPQKLAIRLDLLNEHEVFRQNPAYSDDRRLYAALNYRVWEPKRGSAGILGRSTLRANFEIGQIKGVPPNPLSPLSTIDQWFDYANPNLNNWYVDASMPYRNTATNGIANPRVYDRNGTLIAPPGTTYNQAALTTLFRDTFGITNFQGSPLFRNWALIFADPNSGQAGVGFTNPALAGIQGFQGTIPGGNAFDPGGALRATGDRYRGVAGFYRTQLRDRNVFDYFNYLLTGVLDYRQQEFDATDIRFEQLLFGGKAGFELAYNKQSFTRTRNFPIAGGEEEIYIDVNKFLSVRDSNGNSIANPNFGRPFINSSDVFRDQAHNIERQAYQLTGFLKHDFGKSESKWMQMLGRHTLSTLLFKTDIDRTSRFYRSTWDPAGELNPTTSTAAGPGLFASQVNGWFYLGDSLANLSSAADVRISPISAQLPQYGQTYTLRIYDPVSRTFKTGTSTPLRILNRIPIQKEDLTSTAFGLQSSWLKDHISTVVGWREDRDENITALTPPTLPTGSLDESQITFVPSVSSVVRTWTKSVVGKAPFTLPGDIELRAFWNDSGNFNPIGQRRNIWNEELGSPTATTEEYGLMFSAFRGKLDIRVNRYRTEIANQTIGSFNPYNYISTMISRMLAARDANLIPANFGYGNASHTFNTFSDVALAFYETIPQRLKNNIGPDKNFSPNFTGSGSTLQWEPDNFVGLASVSDTRSTGTEFEAIVNPTRNWRISLNYVRNEAVKEDVAVEELAFAADWKNNLETMYGGALRFGHRQPTSVVTGDNTFWSQYNAETLLAIRTANALSGTPSPEIRKWRLNLVTRYDFRNGPLKGVHIGGALRTQAKAIIGFPLIPNADGQNVSDLANPYYGPSEINVDASIGYTRRFKFYGKNMTWNINVNVRNLNAKDEVIPIAANADGTWGVFRVPPDRTWAVTNSLSF